MTTFESFCPHCGAIHGWENSLPLNSTCIECQGDFNPTEQAIEFEVVSDGIFSFVMRDGSLGNSKWFDLDLNGELLYRICSLCETCSAIFERVRSANLPVAPQRLSELFGDGLKFIPKEVIETVSVLLPKGRYLVGLLTLVPTLSRSGDRPWYMHFHPEYGWMGAEQENVKQARFEVIWPIVPEKNLNQDRIKYYETRLAEGEEPTALALSVHMKRYLRGSFLQWSLSHFLLDGHHKMMAASNESKPLTMLSFLYKGPNRPSLDPELGEEDIRRYYAGGELTLGRLYSESKDIYLRIIVLTLIIVAMMLLVLYVLVSSFVQN